MAHQSLSLDEAACVLRASQAGYVAGAFTSIAAILATPNGVGAIGYSLSSMRIDLIMAGGRQWHPAAGDRRALKWHDTTALLALLLYCECLPEILPMAFFHGIRARPIINGNMTLAIQRRPGQYSPTMAGGLGVGRDAYSQRNASQCGILICFGLRGDAITTNTSTAHRRSPSCHRSRRRYENCPYDDLKQKRR